MGMPSSNFAQGGKDYVGSEACKECHEKVYGDFQKNIHSKKAIPGSPGANKGCESCHGPGGNHVAKSGAKGSIIAFDKTSAAPNKAAQCLRCHEESKTLAFWDMSKHHRQDVSCDNCHSIHAPRAKRLLAAKQPEVCYSCHNEVKLQAMKQSRHPIQEGKVKCTDCHNTHGGFSDKQLAKDSVNDTCFQCHAEKRGPFAFEHLPVAENCGNCHTPHGSNHNRLLVRKAPQLCQSCHDTSGHNNRAYGMPYTFGGGETASRKMRLVSKGCMNCHGNIHGSMLSEFFIR